MASAKHSTDKVTAGASLLLGAVMSLGSVGVISGIALVFTWINEGFAKALTTFGIVAVYGCLILVLCPVFGLIVSLSNKSWYAFKLWTAATAISLVLNLGVGLAALWLGSLLQQGEESAFSRPMESARPGLGPIQGRR